MPYTEHARRLIGACQLDSFSMLRFLFEKSSNCCDVGHCTLRCMEQCVSSVICQRKQGLRRAFIKSTQLFTPLCPYQLDCAIYKSSRSEFDGQRHMCRCIGHQIAGLHESSTEMCPWRWTSECFNYPLGGPHWPGSISIRPWMAPFTRVQHSLER
jgi:hypothetical protein